MFKNFNKNGENKDYLTGLTWLSDNDGPSKLKNPILILQMKFAECDLTISGSDCTTEIKLFLKYIDIFVKNSFIESGVVCLNYHFAFCNK